MQKRLVHKQYGIDEVQMDFICGDVFDVLSRRDISYMTIVMGGARRLFVLEIDVSITKTI